jgi:hypothetical protein
MSIVAYLLAAVACIEGNFGWALFFFFIAIMLED